MNERIKELAEQASLYAVSDNSSMLFDVWKKRYTEKLAELIVEECVNLMENQREHYYSKILGQQSAEHYDRIISKGDAFDEAANIIRKHFGVE